MKEINSNLMKIAFFSKKAQLVFFQKIIEDKLIFLNSLSHRYGIKFLLSLKSLPDVSLQELFLKYEIDFESSNLKEALPYNASHIFWFNPPFFDPEIKKKYPRAVVSLNQKKENLNGEYALRINTSFLGKNSRFGLYVEDINFLMDQKIKINGLHFHHGSEQNTNLDYKKMYLKALDLVKMFDLKEVKYINLGGGLHELTDTEIKELCSYLSKQEKKHQVIFEPGQYIFKNSGYLTTKILERREFGEDILLVTNASKLNHLNWSTPKLLHSGEEASTRKVKIYGPTCYEEDYLGCYEVSEEFAAHSMNEGDILLFSNISSYSANLNRSFNGIDKAEVHIVGSH